MNNRIVMALDEDESGKQIIATHFGNCNKFKVFELNEQNELVKVESYFNPLVGNKEGYCQIPGYIKQFNVKAIIAGKMEQETIDKFLNLGISIFFAPGFRYKDAFNLYFKDKLDGCRCYGNRQKQFIS